MAMKTKISKEDYEKLSDEMKAEYKSKDDGYVLDLDDNDIAPELRRAKDREKQRADEAEKAQKIAEEKLAEIQGNDARKAGDIDAIEKSWKEKLEKAEREGKAATDKLKASLEASMLDGQVNALAAEIFVNPKRDARLIRDRVYVDMEGEKPVVRVRDADGKPSALTLEDLKRETLDNEDFADILVGSRATGSGGGGGNKGSGAAKQPSEYTEQERVELYRTNPAKFNQLFPPN